MGLLFSQLWERIVGTKDMRLVMVGLDAAGKVMSSTWTIRVRTDLFYFFQTTILYKLKLGEVINTIPTVGKLLFLIFEKANWFSL